MKGFGCFIAMCCFIRGAAWQWGFILEWVKGTQGLIQVRESSVNQRRLRLGSNEVDIWSLNMELQHSKQRGTWSSTNLFSLHPILG
jgi:hypothetical protein